MRLPRQFQACLFIYLFLQKGFEHKKTLASKTQPIKQN